jgi:hypothetical protein
MSRQARSAVLALAAALGASLALAGAACNGGDVVLATIPVSDEAGPSGPIRCNGLGDCPSDAYCAKAACGDVTGTCQLLPAECGQPEQHAAVCGCDGITYFDDCLRQAGGVAASTPGPCWQGVATICGGAAHTACPAGAYCAQLGGPGPGPCGPEDDGTCWVLPLSCPPPGNDQWTPCQGGPCVDTCNAIRSGGSYHRAQVCH